MNYNTIEYKTTFEIIGGSCLMVIIFSRHHLVLHVFRFFFINLLLISFTFYLQKLVKSMIHLGEIPGKMAIEGEIVRYFFLLSSSTKKK
jgi:hypothetical protein